MFQRRLWKSEIQLWTYQLVILTDVLIWSKCRQFCWGSNCDSLQIWALEAPDDSKRRKIRVGRKLYKVMGLEVGIERESLKKKEGRRRKY